MSANITSQPTKAAPHVYIPSQTATKTQIMASKGNLYGFYVENEDPANAIYLQFFDKLAADVTVGTTAPDFVYRVPAGSSIGKDPMDVALRYMTTGCTIAATTTRTGLTGPGSNVAVQVWFQTGL